MTSESEKFHMEPNSDHIPVHPDPQFTPGYMPNIPNLNLLPHSSTTVNLSNHFMDHSSNNCFYGLQHKTLHGHQLLPHIEVGYGPPYFVCNPHMSSSGRFFPLPATGSSEQTPFPGSQGAGIRIDGYGGRNQFIDARGLNKRKNPELVPRHFYYHNAAASSSSSSNSGLQCCDGSNIYNTPYFIPTEHPNGLLPTEDGHQQNVRRPNMVCLQREPFVVPHQNHLLHRNFMGPFHPPSNTTVDHIVGNIGDAGSSTSPYNWSYTHATSTSSGRSLNRGSFEMGNYDTSGFQDFTSNRNPVENMHTIPHQPLHHHIQSVQGMHSHSFNHHQVSIPPYNHSANNSAYHDTNLSRDVINSGYRFLGPFPSRTPEGIHGPPRHNSLSDVGFTNGLVDPIIPEDVAVLQFSGIGIEDLSDHHRDMRMDIDSMSYEELLALQEQIGDVHTGLSEEYVLKHLKTRVHDPFASLSLSIQPPGDALESGTCIICQVEFEENERIGSLDCGHYYHADCIKQWLLLKNLCPICKTTGLAVGKRKGLEP